MTIWILTLLLLGSGVGMGLRQGAIRASFSFVGILFAGLLAVPVGKLFKLLMPHLGIHNPTVIWATGPIEAFALVLVIFKVGGFFVHRKVDLYYKYKAGDLRLALWERLNSRLGACVGVLNGALYLIFVSFVIFNLSYFTVQVATSDTEAKTVRLANQLGQDLESSGMAGAACAIGTLPPNYYKTADLAGLICQNPQVSERLQSYPAFISLFERQDFQALIQSSDFTNAFQSHAPIGQLMNQPAVQSIVQNNELVETVWTMVQTNIDDLTAYLKTGKSVKYDSEQILGYWDFNPGVTVALMRVAQPNLTASQMQSVRAWIFKSYADTKLIAGADGQVFLKNLPKLKPGTPPTTEIATWTGSWSKNDDSYDLTLTANNENKSFSAKISSDRITLTDDKNTLIFDRE